MMNNRFFFLYAFSIIIFFLFLVYATDYDKQKVNLSFGAHKATDYNTQKTDFSFDTIEKCYSRILKLDEEGRRQAVIYESLLFKKFYLREHDGLEKILKKNL
ncbi:hypothetical protein [Desulforhopalus sp. IMCC35007]|uniref:hypothetical protein n=1 Tax=Desulforhopalus sp. IMCC35007 TaxID=2569543 RepID=UPI0010AEBF46|nr:hypothetical protein [Desulforhopalus sp. IMCC35007]TKB07420.1 hypothetical protein FCL48_16905 [Desulforhopalus sp. IMCC35007]